MGSSSSGGMCSTSCVSSFWWLLAQQEDTLSGFPADGSQQIITHTHTGKRIRKKDFLGDDCEGGAEDMRPVRLFHSQECLYHIANDRFDVFKCLKDIANRGWSREDGHNVRTVHRWNRHKREERERKKIRKGLVFSISLVYIACTCRLSSPSPTPKWAERPVGKERVVYSPRQRPDRRIYSGAPVTGCIDIPALWPF